MKRLTSLLFAVAITFCLLIGSERRAWGYVDPGSGLIALQTFASVAAAYLYIARRRLRAFFTRKQSKPDSVTVTAEASQTREIA